MESYTYLVGSNGFNQEAFEDLCELIGVIQTLSLGEPTQYGETLNYSLRIPPDKVDMIISFINDAPNKMLFSKNI